MDEFNKGQLHNCFAVLMQWNQNMGIVNLSKNVLNKTNKKRKIPEKGKEQDRIVTKDKNG